MAITQIEFACDECEKTNAFPAEAVGTVQQCSHCGAYVDVEWPDEVQEKSARDEIDAESERQWKESARQLEVARQQQVETGRQLEITRRQQEDTARQMQKTEALQTQVEDAVQHFHRFLNRCELLAERFESVLKRLDDQNSA